MHDDQQLYELLPVTDRVTTLMREAAQRSQSRGTTADHQTGMMQGCWQPALAKCSESLTSTLDNTGSRLLIAEKKVVHTSIHCSIVKREKDHTMNKLARSSYHKGKAFHRETSPESQENMSNQLALLQGRENK